MAEELYTYWEGDMPEHVQRCVEISKRYGLHVYGPNAMTFPGHVVSPHHRADYFRAHKLADDGGVYIDADAILYRDPCEAFQRIEGKTLYGCGWASGEPSIGLLYATERDMLCDAWAQAQDNCTELGWTSFGARILWPLVAVNTTCQVCDAHYAFVAPFHMAHILTKHVRMSSVLQDGAICTHLNNKTTGDSMTGAMNDPQSLVSQLMCLARHRAGIL